MKYLSLFILLLAGIYLGQISNGRDYEKTRKDYKVTQERVNLLIQQRRRSDESRKILLAKPASDTELITEIAKVFGPEGKWIIAKAIQCGLSESGLRAEAVNYNKDGSYDSNLFQVNSIHARNYGDKFKTDWRENIRVSYLIYKSWGNSFRAWYGSGCR